MREPKSIREFCLLNSNFLSTFFLCDDMIGRRDFLWNRKDLIIDKDQIICLRFCTKSALIGFQATLIITVRVPKNYYY